MFYKIKNKMIYILLLLILILIDIYSKYFVSTHLSYNDPIILIKNFLNIRYINNLGEAFSILSGKNISLILPAIIFSVVALYYILFKNIGKFYNFILIFIISGAIGNLYDRILFGYVRDFIQIKLFNFPIFNIADIYITVSVIILIFYLLFFAKE